jgi:hypothetical protein
MTPVVADYAEAHALLAGPPDETADRLSRHLAGRCPHSALIIATATADGEYQPRARTGTPAEATIGDGELRDIAKLVAPGKPFRDDALLLGAVRHVIAVKDDTTAALLIVVPTQPDQRLPADFSAAFALCALLIAHCPKTQISDQVLDEPAAIARAIGELADTTGSTLTALLAVLRSPDLDDAQARSSAIKTATVGLVALRTRQAATQPQPTETLANLVERARVAIGDLIGDLPITLRHGHATGHGERTVPRPLADEALTAARAVVGTCANQPDVDHIRTEWTHKSRALVLDVYARPAARVPIEDLHAQLEAALRTTCGTVQTRPGAPGWNPDNLAAAAAQPGVRHIAERRVGCQ